MPDYNRVAAKIMQLQYGIFKNFYNCGAPSKHFPVNLYFETADLRFYIACIFNKWSIDYTKDMNISARTEFTHIKGIKNQTEAINVIKHLLSGEKFKLTHDGKCVAEEPKKMNSI